MLGNDFKSFIAHTNSNDDYVYKEIRHKYFNFTIFENYFISWVSTKDVATLASPSVDNPLRFRQYPPSHPRRRMSFSFVITLKSNTEDLRDCYHAGNVSPDSFLAKQSLLASKAGYKGHYNKDRAFSLAQLSTTNLVPKVEKILVTGLFY